MKNKKAIGFVTPNYPGEQRVALLPDDLERYRKNMIYDELYVEEGFGKSLGIADANYRAVGCHLLGREQIFQIDTIFSLKLIQPMDFPLLRNGHRIMGWMHPLGSGKSFCSTTAREIGVTIFDIDSVYPRIYRPDGTRSDVRGLPKHFLWKNSYVAGIAATKLALSSTSFTYSQSTKVAILGSGSVSQGAFFYISSLGMQPRMFYRKTLDIFKEQIGKFDLIINGIEMDLDEGHVISRQLLQKTKTRLLLVDAAADAGRAIEGTDYQTLDKPIAFLEERAYCLVNNAPSLMSSEASLAISSAVSQHLLSKDFFSALIE
jgi:N5-(carboxyethyl)ornithine synthase